MQIPPAAVIASWPTPNYTDPVVRGNAVIVMNLILYPIVLSILAIRIFTRISISKSFGADDYLIVLALIPATGYAVIALLSELHFGLNRHVWDVDIADLVMGIKLLVTAQVAFTLAQSLTKLSMLALTYRIMSSSSGTLRNLTRSIITLVILEGLIFITVVIFQCRPPSLYWTLSITPQRCINQGLHLLIASIINTMTDFLVVTFPIPVVLKLQLQFRQQIIITLLFAGGYIVCIAGGVRTYYTYHQFTSYDPTWAAYPDWIACSVEMYIGLICASVPSTQPFFKKYIPRLLNSSISSIVPWSRSHSKLDKSQPGIANSRGSRMADIELGGVHSPFKRLDNNTGPDSSLAKRLCIIKGTEVDNTSGTGSRSFCDGQSRSRIETELPDAAESDDELVNKGGRMVDE